MKLFPRALIAALLLVTAGCVAPVKAPNSSPTLIVLGVMQDAGYPQAGCYAAHCLPGWRDARAQKSAVSLGLIDPVAQHSLLFEATPDLGQQLYDLRQASSTTNLKLGGIFLTHAHIGHYTGLMHLGHEAMGAQGVPVYTMPRMHQYLSNNGPWSQLVELGNIELRPLNDTEGVRAGQTLITPMLVPHRDEYSETVGFRIEGPNRSALFIPDINKWADWQIALTQAIAKVDFALLDATFFDDGELPGRDMSKIPHPFVRETMDLLQLLPDAERNKVWFIHFNHSNPLLRADSAASREVLQRGYNISYVGLRLPL